MPPKLACAHFCPRNDFMELATNVVSFDPYILWVKYFCMPLE